MLTDHVHKPRSPHSRRASSPAGRLLQRWICQHPFLRGPNDQHPDKTTRIEQPLAIGRSRKESGARAPKIGATLKKIACGSWNRVVLDRPSFIEIDMGAHGMVCMGLNPLATGSNLRQPLSQSLLLRPPQFDASQNFRFVPGLGSRSLVGIEGRRKTCMESVRTQRKGMT